MRVSMLMLEKVWFFLLIGQAGMTNRNRVSQIVYQSHAFTQSSLLQCLS